MNTLDTTEKKRIRSREYYKKNRTYMLAKAKEDYARNKDAKIKYSEEYRQSSQHNPDRFINISINTMRKSAKERNIPFHLNKEDIKGLLIASNGICAISGLCMDTIFNSQMKASIDRIDSTKGYTMDNVQVVAGCVNRAKNVLSHKDFITMCKAIAEANV